MIKVDFPKTQNKFSRTTCVFIIDFCKKFWLNDHTWIQFLWRIVGFSKYTLRHNKDKTMA